MPSIVEKLALLVALSFSSAACSSEQSAPELDPISDQIVEVGADLVLSLRATDSDADDLEFAFYSNIHGIQERAVLTRGPDGNGVFKWRPLAEDVGEWFFDFKVSDGSENDQITVRVEVVAALGSAAAPTFRLPLGSGSSLDLAVATCVEVPILVEDPDSPSVTIVEREPRIEGATLERTGPMSATWRWCPSTQQIQASLQHPLFLLATDDDRASSEKRFLIFLRPSGGQICPGRGPQITHAARDLTGGSDVPIIATISDDLGLGAAPAVYWSTSRPTTPIDLSALSRTEMRLETGTMSQGVWQAIVPSPAAALAEGDHATLFYLIAAKDADDVGSGCEHEARAPVESAGAFKIEVTKGTSGCFADSQEEDDDAPAAKAIDLTSGAFDSSSRTACRDDADWSELRLSTGDIVEVDLSFRHAGGDLDLAFYDASMADRCTNSCRTTTDLEHFELTVTEACSSCSFYLVVRGYRGAENGYQLNVRRRR